MRYKQIAQQLAQRGWRFIALATALATLTVSSPALAERKEVDLRLPTREGESFEVLTRRAETLARVAAQTAFDNEILVSDVSIKITVQDGNRAAMLLQMNVSRPEWRQRPDPRVWSTYFPGTKALLGFL